MGDIESRVAARYKDRKKTEKGNTVYLYSDRQIARRNNEKAKRLEQLRKNVHKVRAQVKKDLASGDPEKVLTALAVGLMDHTAERVGNDESAEDGHYGVTGWQKDHVKFSKGKATVSYVGKSGVKQKKVVSDKALVKALKDAYEACEDGSIFCHEAGTVNASKVNKYLKQFDITAKDLRGLHANQTMREKLKAIRKGELPKDPKERKKQLKEEFKKALEETAADVGHEPSTLRSQYLVPGLEEEYMKGKVMDKMTKEAAVVDSVALRYLVAQKVVHLNKGPRIKIRGRTYALSDYWPAMQLDEEGLDGQGARLIKSPGGDKFKYLWAYDTDKDILAMWRVSDGNEKEWGRASSQAVAVAYLDKKGQLNRLSHAEFQDVEKDMHSRADDHEHMLRKWVQELASDWDKKVEEAIQTWFNRDILPNLQRKLDDIDRGVIPFGFKVNDRLLDHRSRDDQARMYVTAEALKYSLEDVEKIVEKETGTAVDSPGLDSQATYFAWNDFQHKILEAVAHRKL